MSSSSARSALRAQIAPYLRTNPRSTAAEIADALGVSKKRVNALLYRHEEFQSDGATRPNWTVVSSAPAAPPLEKPGDATVASTTVPSRQSALIERNAEIVQRFLAGATLEELAKDFSLSRLRIRKILKSEPSPGALTDDRKIQDRDESLIARRLAGAEIAELATEFSLSVSRVRQILDSDERTCGLKVARRPLSARDEQMIRMRAEGRTLQDIADRFELTRERVRQILIRHEHAVKLAAQSRQQVLIEAISAGLIEGNSISEIAESLGVPADQVESLLVPRTDDDQDAIGELRAHAAELAAERVREFLYENPGLTLKAAADATACSTSFILRAAKSLARRLTVPEESDSRAASAKVWSDEQILDVIRLAATYEYPITTKHFEHLRSIGEISAPSVPLVHTRFGGWRAACEAAGVEPGETLRHSYDSRWTDADLLRFAGQFLADESSDGTYSGFEKWLTQDDDRPSGATVRNRLGGWLDIKRAALTADGFKDMLRERR